MLSGPAFRERRGSGASGRISFTMNDNGDTLSKNLAQTGSDDPSIPCDIDGVPIKWYGNPAHVEGVTYELEQWLSRIGTYESLFQHNAVLTANGKLAVDNLQAVSFITGVTSDPIAHSYSNPCPETPARISRFNVESNSGKSVAVQ